MQGDGDAQVLLTDNSIDVNNNGSISGIEIIASSSSLIIQDYASKEIYNFTENVSVPFKNKTSVSVVNI